MILWADTFNNYFHPETAIAAVEVLEAAGCEVVVPHAGAMLRPAALRFRHAGSGEAAAAPDNANPRTGYSRWHAYRRSGASMRVACFGTNC